MGNFSVYVLTVVRWRGYGVCSVTYSLSTKRFYQNGTLSLRGLLVCVETRKRCSVGQNPRRVVRHIFCCALTGGFWSHTFLKYTCTDFVGELVNNTHTTQQHTNTHTHKHTNTHSPSVFVWCEWLFDGVKKSVTSLSFSLSPRNQNNRWIVSECVRHGMSICEVTISNMSRFFLCVWCMYKYIQITRYSENMSVCVCVCFHWVLSYACIFMSVYFYWYFTKSEIDRSIMRVLGSMSVGCVGVEVDHLLWWKMKEEEVDVWGD